MALRIKVSTNVKSKSKSKPKLSKVAKKGTVKGSRPIGRTTGLPIQQAWVQLFKDNAKRHLSDEAITKWMLKEFPGRDSKVFHAVAAVRSKYNSGGLTGGEAPKVRALQYDAEGNPKKPQSGTGSKPVAKRKKK